MPTAAPASDAATTPPRTRYSLLDEDWIPCQLLDGTVRSLSLRSVFAQSSNIHRVVGETPLQTVTIYRLLLAILWRAHLEKGDLLNSSPSSWWIQLFTALTPGQEPDGFSQPVQDYLTSLAGRFDLLDPNRPFMQVADLQKPDGSYSRIDRLVMDAESTYFSTRAGIGREHLSFAAAARWLLVINAYDYAGIKPGVVDDERVKGGKSYPIGPGWAGQTGQVIIHGRNLAQTLLLNTPASLIVDAAENSQDLASWEQEELLPIPKATGELFPSGPCNALTWPSRRVRLHINDHQVVGVLITNGYKIINKNQHTDPLTGYRYSKNQSSKAGDVFMPMEHASDLTMWRGIQALLTREGVGLAPVKGQPSSKPPANIDWLQKLHRNELIENQTVNVELFGVEYGPQQSSVVNVFSSMIPLNLKILMEQDLVWANHIVHATIGTMEASTELGRFAGNLLAAGGGNYVFDADVKRALLHSLEAPFSHWLQQLTPETDMPAHRLRWEQEAHDMVLSHAWQLIDSASPRALRGTLSEGGHFVSAATALSTLRARLDVHLPQTAAARKEAKIQQPHQSSTQNEAGESKA